MESIVNVPRQDTTGKLKQVLERPTNYKLITLDDVTNACCISLMSARRLMDSGAFKTVKIGRSVRILEESLLQFIENGGTKKVGIRR